MISRLTLPQAPLEYCRILVADEAPTTDEWRKRHEKAQLDGGQAVVQIFED